MDSTIQPSDSSQLANLIVTHTPSPITLPSGDVKNIFYHPTNDKYYVTYKNGSVYEFSSDFGLNPVCLNKFEIPDLEFHVFEGNENVFVSNKKLFNFRAPCNSTFALANSLNEPVRNLSSLKQVDIEFTWSEITYWATFVDSLIEYSSGPKEAVSKLKESTLNFMTMTGTDLKGSKSAVITVHNPIELFAYIKQHLGTRALGSPFTDFQWFLLLEKLRLALYPADPYFGSTSTLHDPFVVRSEMCRLLTFHSWPHDFVNAIPFSMAASGFYHDATTISPDRCYCYACGVCLVTWETTDEPSQEHERYSSECTHFNSEFTSNIPMGVTLSSTSARKLVPFNMEASQVIVGKQMQNAKLLPIGINNDNECSIVFLKPYGMVEEDYSVYHFGDDQLNQESGPSLSSNVFLRNPVKITALCTITYGGFKQTGKCSLSYTDNFAGSFDDKSTTITIAAIQVKLNGKIQNMISCISNNFISSIPSAANGIPENDGNDENVEMLFQINPEAKLLEDSLIGYASEMPHAEENDINLGSFHNVTLRYVNKKTQNSLSQNLSVPSLMSGEDYHIDIISGDYDFSNIIAVYNNTVKNESYVVSYPVRSQKNEDVFGLSDYQYLNKIENNTIKKIAFTDSDYTISHRHRQDITSNTLVLLLNNGSLVLFDLVSGIQIEINKGHTFEDFTLSKNQALIGVTKNENMLLNIQIESPLISDNANDCEQKLMYSLVCGNTNQNKDEVLKETIANKMLTRESLNEMWNLIQISPMSYNKSRFSTSPGKERHQGNGLHSKYRLLTPSVWKEFRKTNLSSVDSSLRQDHINDFDAKTYAVSPNDAKYENMAYQVFQLGFTGGSTFSHINLSFKLANINVILPEIKFSIMKRKSYSEEDNEAFKFALREDSAHLTMLDPEIFEQYVEPIRGYSKISIMDYANIEENEVNIQISYFDLCSKLLSDSCYQKPSDEFVSHYKPSYFYFVLEHEPKDITTQNRYQRILSKEGTHHILHSLKCRRNIESKRDNKQSTSNIEVFNEIVHKPMAMSKVEEDQAKNENIKLAIFKEFSIMVCDHKQTSLPFEQVQRFAMLNDNNNLYKTLIMVASGAFPHTFGSEMPIAYQRTHSCQAYDILFWLIGSRSKHSNEMILNSFMELFEKKDLLASFFEYNFVFGTRKLAYLAITFLSKLLDQAKKDANKFEAYWCLLKEHVEHNLVRLNSFEYSSSIHYFSLFCGSFIETVADVENDKVMDEAIKLLDIITSTVSKVGVIYGDARKESKYLKEIEEEGYSGDFFDIKMFDWPKLVMQLRTTFVCNENQDKNISNKKRLAMYNYKQSMSSTSNVANNGPIPIESDEDQSKKYRDLYSLYEQALEDKEHPDIIKLIEHTNTLGNETYDQIPFDAIDQSKWVLPMSKLDEYLDTKYEFFVKRYFARCGITRKNLKDESNTFKVFDFIIKNKSIEMDENNKEKWPPIIENMNCYANTGKLANSNECNKINWYSMLDYKLINGISFKNEFEDYSLVSKNEPIFYDGDQITSSHAKEILMGTGKYGALDPYAPKVSQNVLERQIVIDHSLFNGLLETELLFFNIIGMAGHVKQNGTGKKIDVFPCKDNMDGFTGDDFLSITQTSSNNEVIMERITSGSIKTITIDLLSVVQLTHILFPPDEILSSVEMYGWKENEKNLQVIAFSRDISKRALILNNVTLLEPVRYLKIVLKIGKFMRDNYTFTIGNFYGNRCDSNGDSIYSLNSLIDKRDNLEASFRYCEKNIINSMASPGYSALPEFQKMISECYEKRAKWNITNQIIKREIDSSVSQPLQNIAGMELFSRSPLKAAEANDFPSGSIGKLQTIVENLLPILQYSCHKINLKRVLLHPSLTHGNENVEKINLIKTKLESIIDLETAVLIFDNICVNGNDEAKVRAISFLFHQCHTLIWWPKFFTTILELEIIPHEDNKIDESVFLLLNFALQNTVKMQRAHAPVMKELLCSLKKLCSQKLTTSIAHIITWNLTLCSSAFDIIVTNKRKCDRWSFIAGDFSVTTMSAKNAVNKSELNVKMVDTNAVSNQYNFGSMKKSNLMMQNGTNVNVITQYFPSHLQQMQGMPIQNMGYMPSDNKPPPGFVQNMFMSSVPMNHNMLAGGNSNLGIIDTDISQQIWNTGVNVGVGPSIWEPIFSTQNASNSMTGQQSSTGFNQMGNYTMPDGTTQAFLVFKKEKQNMSLASSAKISSKKESSSSSTRARQYSARIKLPFDFCKNIVEVLSSILCENNLDSNINLPLMAKLLSCKIIAKIAVHGSIHSLPLALILKEKTMHLIALMVSKETNYWLKHALSNMFADSIDAELRLQMRSVTSSYGKHSKGYADKVGNESAIQKNVKIEVPKHALIIDTSTPHCPSFSPITLDNLKMTENLHSVAVNKETIQIGERMVKILNNEFQKLCYDTIETNFDSSIKTNIESMDCPSHTAVVSGIEKSKWSCMVPDNIFSLANFDNIEDEQALYDHIMIGMYFIRPSDMKVCGIHTSVRITILLTYIFTFLRRRLNGKARFVYIFRWIDALRAKERNIAFSSKNVEQYLSAMILELGEAGGEHYELDLEYETQSRSALSFLGFWENVIMNRNSSSKYEKRFKLSKSSSLKNIIPEEVVKMEQGDSSQDEDEISSEISKAKLDEPTSEEKDENTINDEESVKLTLNLFKNIQLKKYEIEYIGLKTEFNKLISEQNLTRDHLRAPIESMFTYCSRMSDELDHVADEALRHSITYPRFNESSELPTSSLVLKMYQKMWISDYILMPFSSNLDAITTYRSSHQSFSKTNSLAICLDSILRQSYGKWASLIKSNHEKKVLGEYEDVIAKKMMGITLYTCINVFNQLFLEIRSLGQNFALIESIVSGYFDIRGTAQAKINSLLVACPKAEFYFNEIAITSQAIESLIKYIIENKNMPISLFNLCFRIILNSASNPTIAAYIAHSDVFELFVLCIFEAECESAETNTGSLGPVLIKPLMDLLEKLTEFGDLKSLLGFKFARIAKITIANGTKAFQNKSDVLKVLAFMIKKIRFSGSVVPENIVEENVDLFVTILHSAHSFLYNSYEQYLENRQSSDYYDVGNLIRDSDNTPTICFTNYLENSMDGKYTKNQKMLTSDYIQKPFGDGIYGNYNDNIKEFVMKYQGNYESEDIENSIMKYDKGKNKPIIDRNIKGMTSPVESAHHIGSEEQFLLDVFPHFLHELHSDLFTKKLMARPESNIILACLKSLSYCTVPQMIALEDLLKDNLRRDAKSLGDFFVHVILTLTSRSRSNEDVAEKVARDFIAYLETQNVHALHQLLAFKTLPQLNSPGIARMSVPLAYVYIKIMNVPNLKSHFIHKDGLKLISSQVLKYIKHCSQVSWDGSTSLISKLLNLSNVVNGIEDKTPMLKASNFSDKETNFAPSCYISSSIEHMPPNFGQVISVGNAASKRIRSVCWNYSFLKNESYVSFTFLLPHQILLREVSLRLANTVGINSVCVQIAVASDPSLTTWRCYKAPQTVHGKSKHVENFFKYPNPVYGIRIFFKKLEDMPVLSLQQISITGFGVIDNLRFDSRISTGALNWMAVLSKVSTLDCTNWVVDASFGSDLITFFMRCGSQKKLYQYIIKIMHNMDSLTKPGTPNIVYCFMKYIEDGNDINVGCLQYFAEFLMESCTLSESQSLKWPIHLCHLNTVLRQKQLLQCVATIIQQPKNYQKLPYDREYLESQLLWVASCVVWKNTSDVAIKHDTTAHCIETGEKIIALFAPSFVNKIGVHLGTSLAWLMCSYVRACPKLLHKILVTLELLSESNAVTHNMEFSVMSFMGMVCQSSTAIEQLKEFHVLSTYTETLFQICINMDLSRTYDLYNIIIFFAKISTVEDMCEYLDSLSLEKFIHPLLNFVSSEELKESTIGKCSVILDLVDVTIDLLHNLTSFGGGFRSKIAETVTNILITSKERGLTPATKELIYRVILADEWMYIKITDNRIKYRNYLSDSCIAEVTHPLFGCEKGTKVVKASMYADIKTYFPALFLDDLEEKTERLKAIRAQTMQLNKQMAELKAQLGLKNKNQLIEEQKKEYLLQKYLPKPIPVIKSARLFCDSYSSKYSLKKEWNIGQVIDGLKSVKKFNQRQKTKINEVDKILADEESDVPMNCDVPCSSTYGPDRHESLAFPGDWTDGFQTLFFKLEDPLEPEAFCRRNINDTCQLANVVEDYQQNQSTLFHFAYHGGLCHLTQYIQSISDNYNYIVKLGDTIRNQQTKEEAYIGDNAAIDLDDESIISCPPKKKKTMSDHSTYAADESYHKSILEMKDSFNIQSIIQAELFPENVSEIDEGVEMALNIPKETGYNTKSTKNKKESEEKSMASHFANPKTQELFDENVIPLYVIISLNCFLKLSGYAEALIVKNRADAIILLRILLGIGESKISTAEKEKLTVLPFEVLKSIYETTHLDKESENGAVLLRQQSVEEGVCDIIFTILEHYSHQKSRFDLLRTRSMSEVSTDIGIIKYLLSLNTHFDSFKAKEKIKNARQMPKNLNDYNQALLPYNAPGIGKPNETYWAKGTGFGHGVTSQHWNMNAHINKQKNDEKTVSIMLDIISAFILIKSESTENDRIRSRASSRIGHRSRQNTNTSTNTMNADESGSLNRSRYSISEKSDINDSIMDIPNQIKKDNKYFISLEFVILTFRSSLSEIIKTYLINDSVMDIVKHVAVYESLFKVMLAMAHCEPFSGQYTEVVNPEELGLLKEEHFKSKHLDLIPALINFDNNGTKTFQNFKGIYENVGNYLRQIQKVQCSVSKDVPPQNEYDEEIVKITKKSVECEDDVENNENGLAYLLSQMDILYNLIKPKLEEFSEEMEIDDEVENKSETIEDIYVRTMKSIQFVQMPFKNERDTFIVPYYYANQIASTESGLGSRKRTKRLAQEMITLANSLPLSFGSSIFVRTCEERFDIIKVLITGPKDTPYENGCFEFDCFFPVDYPNSPVLCHLNTTGNNTCRMSPNLYADGKVCLSILNTWHGRPEERWNAETSSLLQVLVSIQSLILVNEPYFNEPGYEKSKNTENGRIASRDYQLGIQQNVVRWAILEQIKNPAKGFVDVIQNHFYLKQNEILEQIKKSIAEAESKDNSSELAGKSQILQHIKSLKFYYDRLVLIFKDFKAPNQMKGNVIEDSPFEKPALKPNESVIDTEVVLPTTSEYNDFMNSNMEY
uniref:UBIQUITIN_CONJUGAT_2 domain-containing protein n=1 Tax=Rhabditophanes sp. KR3021 TaxID=114890 RepID=A0AC35UCQ1_9BILA